MSKIEEKKKKKKQLLLNSSFDLFMSKGWLETTISDIVKHAGVAKGTFYLYFKDKYDIRNNLISYKASILLLDAHKDLLTHPEISDIKEQIVYIVSYVIKELEANTPLLRLLAKNLSWGVFKSALSIQPSEENENFWDLFYQLLPHDRISEVEAEMMLFQITELVGSTTYNIILYKEPASMKEFEPHLENTVRLILDSYLKR